MDKEQYKKGINTKAIDKLTLTLGRSAKKSERANASTDALLLIEALKDELADLQSRVTKLENIK